MNSSTAFSSHHFVKMQHNEFMRLRDDPTFKSQQADFSPILESLKSFPRKTTLDEMNFDIEDDLFILTDKAKERLNKIYKKKKKAGKGGFASLTPFPLLWPYGQILFHFFYIGTSVFGVPPLENW